MTATCIGQTLNGLGGGVSYFIANIFVSQNIDNQTGKQTNQIFFGLFVEMNIFFNFDFDIYKQYFWCF